MFPTKMAKHDFKPSMIQHLLFYGMESDPYVHVWEFEDAISLFYNWTDATDDSIKV